MGMYAGITEAAQSAGKEGRRLSISEDGRKGPKFRVLSIDTCHEVKKSFLIMVTEIIKEYSTHPTAFTTMLQSQGSNHLHDYLWKKHETVQDKLHIAGYS